MNKAINLILFFGMLSFIYFIFIATKKDKELLLSTYKLFFPAAAILIAVIFTYDNNRHKLIIDYNKTLLRFDTENKEKHLLEYSTFMNNYITKFDEPKIDYWKILIDNKSKEVKPSNKVNFIVNICAVLLTELILFIYLWCLVELSVFKTLSFKNSRKSKKTRSILLKINNQS